VQIAGRKAIDTSLKRLLVAVALDMENGIALRVRGANQRRLIQQQPRVKHET
jgi:hypothetical protein